MSESRNHEGTRSIKKWKNKNRNSFYWVNTSSYKNDILMALRVLQSSQQKQALMRGFEACGFKLGLTFDALRNN
jgi:hypothetical protein